MIVENLALAGLLSALSFGIHFLGIIGLIGVLRRLNERPRALVSILSQAVFILGIVGSLSMLHSIQIWIYAFTFLILGEFNTVADALYYSISTFTTVGFGDLNMSEQWRIFGATESMTGFLMIGWSTAFLVSVSSRLFAFERNIEQLVDPPNSP